MKYPSIVAAIGTQICLFVLKQYALIFPYETSDWRNIYPSFAAAISTQVCLFVFKAIRTNSSKLNVHLLPNETSDLWNTHLLYAAIGTQVYLYVFKTICTNFSIQNVPFWPKFVLV